MATGKEDSDMSEDGEDALRRAQIKAYVDWTNAQLKKRPGTRMVEDLKCDMQDGVALLHLVAIIAGSDLEGGHLLPSTASEKMENIEKVIAFMTERRIKMHFTTAKDIVDGNLKAIMRLILALAAHYKPNSVKQSSRSGSRATTPLTGMAQSAAVALAEARRDAAMTIHKPQRPPHLGKIDRPETVGYVSEYSHGDGATSSGSSPSVVRGAYGARGPTYSGAGSPAIAGRRRLEFGMNKSRSQDFPAGHDRQPGQGADDSFSEHDLSVVLGVLDDEHGNLEGDLQLTKQSLLTLQELLLNGRPPDGCEVSSKDLFTEPSSPAESASPAEQIVILRSRLQQSEEVARGLREELSRVRTESMQLQGVKAGLEHRLTEQENSFLVLKAELLRAGFCQQSLENTKNELEQKLSEKDKLLLDLKRDMSQRENQSDELKVDCQIHQRERENATQNMKSHILNLHDRIKKVGENEAGLSSRVSAQDRKMSKLEGKILQCHDSGDPSSGHVTSMKTQSFGSDSEDFHLVRESLRSLRSRFPGDDPQHQTIDALEQSISILMDRLNVTEDQKWNDTSGSRRTFESMGEVRRSPMFGSNRLDNSVVNGHAATKVLYFTDRTVTPFMCTISKRLGDITLRDIKGIQDRPGNYRYHFKAMDPEFGTVKEEITQDDDVIPGWEGKIVAWIEEDHG